MSEREWDDNNNNNIILYTNSTDSNMYWSAHFAIRKKNWDHARYSTGLVKVNRRFSAI